MKEWEDHLTDQIIEKWARYCQADRTLHEELMKLCESGSEEELRKAFDGDLSFGTGGLRGILGVGTNRMNKFTVARATKGLILYLQERQPNRIISVAIGYDSRLQSDVFAKTAAGVLAEVGCQVYLYDRLMPTPLLSFAVRALHCDAGIMITASHNPATYNGYKVYNHYGCQLNLEEAEGVLKKIQSVSMDEVEKIVNSVQRVRTDHGIQSISEEVVLAYEDLVRKQSTKVDCTDLVVVYTPLNGTGNIPVRRILDQIGVGTVEVVWEQELPDGNFPTCPYPNPEKKEALELGLKRCKKWTEEQPTKAPDLLLATDPDCDRLGMAVGHQGDYFLLSGNQTGILLLDYLCSRRVLPEKPLVMKTIVTTQMVQPIANAYGVEVKNVLTGFKFIGEQLDLLEEQGQESRFIFGFEESDGYLVGTFVRDKDAVSAAMLVCEMTAWYKKQGKTLLNRMEELYERFGYYSERLMDITFDGGIAMKKMNIFMETLRVHPHLPAQFFGTKIKEVKDYAKGDTGLPKSNMLVFDFADDSQVVVRPSGTEPKLKLYLSVRSQNKTVCTARMEQLVAAMTGMMKDLRRQMENGETREG